MRVQHKSLHELLSDDPAMPMIRDWLAASPRAAAIELLPCEPAHGAIALEALQVTTRSALGSIAYETGGVLVDHGWLRVLGAGHPRLARTVAGWNGLPCEPGDAYLAGAMFVADDVLGGMFALDVGALGAAEGNVTYFAPGSLRWQDTGLGYSDWLRWAIAGDLEAFYGSTRWPGWEAEVSSLAGTDAFAIEPVLWLEGPPLAERARRPVTIRELRDRHLSLARQRS